MRGDTQTTLPETNSSPAQTCFFLGELPGKKNSPSSKWLEDINHFPTWRTPLKVNMTMEKTTMNEDVFPIENGDFPMSS